MAGMERLLQLNSTDQPETVGIAAEMRRLADSYPSDRLLVGEIYLPIERLVAYYGPAETPGVHLPFNFQLIEAPWRAEDLHRIIGDYEAALPPGAWPNWVLGNHDRPRVATRVGPAQARVAAMLLLTLRGTPTLYYGDEIGMEQVPIPPHRVQDPFEKNVPGLGVGRDGARTPMPWSAAPHAGFSRREPWLPLGEGWEVSNVEQQRREAGSLLSLYRRLIRVRRAHPALSVGTYRPVVERGDLLIYFREHEGERFIVALNLGSEPVVAQFPRTAMQGQVTVSTLGDRDGEAVTAEVALRADEGLVIALAPEAPSPQPIT
jgi:alpha-glucosidase